MITWRKYMQGDIARVNSHEPDPFPGWSDQAEHEGRALTTILRDGHPIVVIGLLDTDPGHAWCFAAFDRELSAGHGRTIVKMLKARLSQAMSVLRIHCVHTSAQANDKAACGLIRAVGMSASGLPDDLGNQQFIIHRSTENGKSEEHHQEG